MENQIQTSIIITSVYFSIFILVTVYLIVRLKLKQIELEKSREKEKDFNKTLQKVVTIRTKKLKESEKNYKALYEFNKELLEKSPAGIIKLDKKLNIEYANPEMQKFLKSSENYTHFIGKNINELSCFAEKKNLQIFEQLIAGKNVSSEIIHKKNSDFLYLIMKGSPIFDEHGFNGAVLHFEDITERINVEKKLKESYEMLRKATEEIIQAMAATIDLRDPYTAGHQKRTQILALAIGKKMNANKEQLEALKFAGMIFDIGKISIPSDLLSKPGKLSEPEFAVVKNHSQIGYEILKKIEFPWPIAKIVHQHHERLNGSGYPNRLKSDEILLEARILAVADVMEAMTSHRPYREAFSVKYALNELKKRKGILYDPKVVDVCIELFEKDNFSYS